MKFLIFIFGLALAHPSYAEDAIYMQSKDGTIRIGMGVKINAWFTGYEMMNVAVQLKESFKADFLELSSAQVIQLFSPLTSRVEFVVKKGNDYETVSCEKVQLEKNESITFRRKYCRAWINGTEAENPPLFDGSRDKKTFFFSPSIENAF